MPLDIALALTGLLRSTGSVLSGAKSAMDMSSNKTKQGLALRRSLPAMREGYAVAEIALASGIPQAEVEPLTTDVEILAEMFKEATEDLGKWEKCMQEKGSVQCAALKAAVGGHNEMLESYIAYIQMQIKRLRKHPSYKVPRLFDTGDKVTDVGSQNGESRLGTVVEIDHAHHEFTYKIQYDDDRTPSTDWVHKWRVQVPPVRPSKQSHEATEKKPAQEHAPQAMQQNQGLLRQPPNRSTETPIEDAPGKYVVTKQTKVKQDRNISSQAKEMLERGQTVQIVDVKEVVDFGGDGQEIRIRGRLDTDGWMTLCLIKSDKEPVRFAEREVENLHEPWLENAVGSLLMTRFRTLLPTQVALGDSTLVGLYVSGAWCPPCRLFTPSFADAYKKLGRNSGLEIIYCSCDLDEHSYNRYFFQSPCQQPWLAVPFFKGAGRGGLPHWLPQKMLKYIQGVPSLVIFERHTGKIVCGNGRDVVQAKNFDLNACVNEWGRMVRSHQECDVQNPEADKCDLEPVLENKVVVIQGLQKAPQHNGKFGKVRKWDGQRARCTVELEDGTPVDIRPSNFIQQCSARVDGDEDVYDGSECTIIGHSDGLYTVRVNNALCHTVCPSNIILERDICVKITGLDKHEELNGQLGKIEEVNMEKRRYTVHLEKGSRVSVKLENVTC